MSLSTQPPSSAQPFKTMSTPPTASLPIKKRTRARELCLQVLYQYDLVGESMLESLGSFLREEETDKDTPRLRRGNGRVNHQATGHHRLSVSRVSLKTGRSGAWL